MLSTPYSFYLILVLGISGLLSPSNSFGVNILGMFEDTRIPHAFKYVFLLVDCVTFRILFYYISSTPLRACRLLVTRLIKCLVLILCPITFDYLRDRVLFEVILLCNICIVYINVSFSELKRFKPYCCMFVHFTIAVLTWYEFTSFSIILLMSISVWVFWPWSICLECLIYVTTQITHKCLV